MTMDNRAGDASIASRRARGADRPARPRRDLKRQAGPLHPLKAWRLRQFRTGQSGRRCPLTLAAAAGLVGCTAHAWQSWEEGWKIPAREKLVELCELTGLMPNDFYFKDGMPYRLYRNQRADRRAGGAA